MALMRAAASEFHVPVSLLLAISYGQTRWERPGDSPSIDGGYGLMDLTARTFPARDWRGTTVWPGARTVTLARTHYTLQEASQLLHVSAATLRISDRQNIRGAAALLAHYARQLTGGALPTSLGGWYGAVAEYSGDRYAQTAQSFADSVFATLAHGASLTTSDRQVMDLPGTPGVQPDRAQLARLELRRTPAAASAPVDCPSTVHCTFRPAAYAQDAPNDPSNYGNYDTAGRPSSMVTPGGQPATMNIKYIIIHDTEGSYSSAISTFQDPASYVSANYVIRSSDGAVTEMVRPANVSWGAGDWYVNMHAINIENEGFAAQGRTWYTPAMYTADAALVRYLAAAYGIPLDRQHILGHEDVPGPTDSLTAAQHWDPGPFWNWNHFMALVHQVSDGTEQARGGSLTRGPHHLVTIDPTVAANTPAVTDCCATIPKQPANFVYLRTGPGGSYPLLPDPLLHPRGNGTTLDSDWGDKATIEQTFVFAGQAGNWTAIWFGGRKAWFYNPPGRIQTARYTSGTVITPRTGLASIPVYGAAYPEASAYSGTPVPVKQVVKLSYTIGAGQQYPTIGAVPTDYYYAATINASLAGDHTLVIGRTAYYQISFNHRKFFVRAADVTVQTLT
jgi:N-acetyl-anhydromuramyl-L-alanine amidase AmpD